MILELGALSGYSGFSWEVSGHEPQVTSFPDLRPKLGGDEGRNSVVTLLAVPMGLPTTRKDAQS